ncbi:MAG: hypothetical protein U0892_13535 [Pirellulales bacterium]
MSEVDGIVDRMVEIRARGLRKARELNADIERLGDWREHVRAHPWPVALAVLAAGYYVVPSRTQRSKSSGFNSEYHGRARAGASENGSAGEETPVSHAEKERAVGFSQAGGAVVGFLGSMAANAVRSYVSSRIQRLLSGNNHDQASFQRQASHPR